MVFNFSNFRNLGRPIFPKLLPPRLPQILVFGIEFKKIYNAIYSPGPNSAFFAKLWYLIFLPQAPQKSDSGGTLNLRKTNFADRPVKANRSETRKGRARFEVHSDPRAQGFIYKIYVKHKLWKIRFGTQRQSVFNGMLMAMAPKCLRRRSAPIERPSDQTSLSHRRDRVIASVSQAIQRSIHPIGQSIERSIMRSSD